MGTIYPLERVGDPKDKGAYQYAIWPRNATPVFIDSRLASPS
jgi:hypothetical protein